MIRYISVAGTEPIYSCESKYTSKAGCISVAGTVMLRGGKIKHISDLIPGDVVLTAEGYSEYICDIHQDIDKFTNVIVATFDNGESIEATAMHLILCSEEYMYMGDITKGKKIVTYDGLQVTVEDVSYKSLVQVSSLLTKSGTIVVNGITLSCYSNTRSHTFVHTMLYPIRHKLVTDPQAFVRNLIKAYEILPSGIRQFVPVECVPKPSDV